MSGKPITTDLNTGTTPPPAQPDAAASAGILSDLRAGADAGGADMGDLSSLTATPKRRLSVQTLVLFLVLVASALALWLMRRQGMGSGMTFKTPTIAHELDKPAPSVQSERKIWADLATAGLPPRDGDARLQKNPFMLDNPGGEGGGPGGAIPDLNAERLNLVREKLAALKLNSVMDGPVPVARINERMVRVGDIIEDVFLVAQIHDRSIDLIADGHTYQLNMGEGTGGANKVKPGSKPPVTQTPRR